MDMEADYSLQVIEYLNKKGYSKTEAMLRMESANQDADGRSIASRAGDPTGAKYGRAFSESDQTLTTMRVLNSLASMRQWIEDGLDIYKVKPLHNNGSSI